MRFKIYQDEFGYRIQCNIFVRLWIELSRPKSEHYLRQCYSTIKKAEEGIEKGLNRKWKQKIVYFKKGEKGWNKN